MCACTRNEGMWECGDVTPLFLGAAWKWMRWFKSPAPECTDGCWIWRCLGLRLGVVPMKRGLLTRPAIDPQFLCCYNLWLISVLTELSCAWWACSTLKCIMHVPCRRTRPTSKCELPSELKTEDFGENQVLILMKTFRAILCDPDYEAKFQPVCSTTLGLMSWLMIFMWQLFFYNRASWRVHVTLCHVCWSLLLLLLLLQLLNTSRCLLWSSVRSFPFSSHISFIMNFLRNWFFFVTSRNFALSAPFVFVSAADFKLF